MGKFVCEPVKYKQLYKWKTNADSCSGGSSCPFPKCSSWLPPSAKTLNLVVTKKKCRGKYPAGFYIAPYEMPDLPPYNEDSPWIDERARFRWLGPYPDLPTAKSVAEVFVTMKQGPRWVWKRPKKEKR